MTTDTRRRRAPCTECGRPGITMRDPAGYICQVCEFGPNDLPPGKWVGGLTKRFVPDPPPPPKVSKLKPCGTAAAARRHRKAGEKPCEPCRKAETRERNKYRRGNQNFNPKEDKP